MPSFKRFVTDPKLATLLGENYRSSEYAIKELVDNAWDADATEVYISLPTVLSNEPIIIRDNGSGMTEQEISNEYLRIASSRKSRQGNRTPLRNRLIKGSKGIGKFAGLLVANSMTIEAKARGKSTRLKLDKNQIIEAQKSNLELPDINLKCSIFNCENSDTGTVIYLEDLNQDLSFPTPEKLREILIIEYGRKTDFKIYVNDNLLSIDDIPGKTFSEESELPNTGKFKFNYTISDNNLKQSGIAIRVKDKIVGKLSYLGIDEDGAIPSKILKRVYGEIEVDDSLADYVTADWGAIVENNKQFQQIIAHTRSNLKNQLVDTFHKEVNLQKARHQKKINEGLAKLPEHKREFAQFSLEKVMRRFYQDSDEKIMAIVTVVLEAFEKDEYWSVIQKIEEAKHQDVQTFAEALDEFGLLDIAMIAQQATRRMQFLDRLDELVNNSETLESTIHKALENNLWIFGTEYSLMSSNKTLARTIETYCMKKFTGERAQKRPDLLLSHSILDTHLLIEFKRPSHQIDRKDENQAEEYRDDLTPDFGKIEIMVIGGRIDSKISPHYQQSSVKLLSYSKVISGARTQIDWLLKEIKDGAIR